MAENGKTRWIHWLVGILWGLIVLIMLTTIQNVIANDKASRERDEKLKDSLYVAVSQQNTINEETNVTLAKILTELKYIRKNDSIN